MNYEERLRNREKLRTQEGIDEENKVVNYLLEEIDIYIPIDFYRFETRISRIEYAIEWAKNEVITWVNNCVWEAWEIESHDSNYYAYCVTRLSRNVIQGDNRF